MVTAFTDVGKSGLGVLDSFRSSPWMLELQASEHKRRKMLGAVRRSVLLAVVPVSTQQHCGCEMMQQESYRGCFDDTF